ncbi:MAG: tetratricopeptide repeat protein [Pegethrix bostrychoides GSE-TBD4-15B]|jgi:curved DNA-binding protein CbpA|uniref:Tetratricopeptide repeat protein n=1 Tax=Pegethrix bostrychoides GSE-TBD4-15B TaxID=2839662 RepID=A0A951P7V2_9CYAN|nr:tetratricopeptide repeat protein [Pegethrix bostrychoides GSE-TBD4-15B]
MSLKIEQGLFNLDFVDHHAILGAPVDADLKEIRKRYLGIARLLHPDSAMLESGADRQLAAEYLSKLVNPAYEKLSQEKSNTEHAVLLRLKGQQALKQQDTVVLTSDSARQVASSSDIDSAYKAALRDLTQNQYRQLDRALELTGQISELNLVYLMRKESRGDMSARRQGAPVSAASEGGTASGMPRTFSRSTPNPAAPPPPKETLVSAYLRRAAGFETKQDYPRAILELRDALKLEPTNSACHSQLGVIYLKTNQATMAKIHFNKALELNPEDAVALEGKRRLEGPSAKSDPKAKAASKPGASKPAGKSSSKEEKGGGGLFGLFGGKKK